MGQSLIQRSPTQCLNRSKKHICEVAKVIQELYSHEGWVGMVKYFVSLK
jgi:hypothetical protein